MATLAPELRSEIIEMAWSDDTPFEAIKLAHGLAEAEVIKLMRQSLKPASFRKWRARVTGRNSKHARRSGSQERAETGSKRHKASFPPLARQAPGVLLY